MSETKPTAGSELGAAQVSDVAGGIDLCSPDQIEAIISGLRQNYDQLIDLASYMIERVNGGSGN
jgi:hypothetical protein